MSIARLIKDHIDKKSLGSVFCANDFYDLGSRGNVDVTLHRLVESGVLRRLGYGLYDKPRMSPLLGHLSPDLSDIIKAYSRKTGQTIILDPLGAANALSLTTQVPAKTTFLTNGKSHILQICGIDIRLTHAAPKKLIGAGTSVGLIMQALRYFGDRMIPEDALQSLSRKLSNKDVKVIRSLKNKTLLSLSAHIERILKYAAVH
ncbi:MAG: hypothetical protein H0X26_09220 [Alphaproteobacteria bacterium]|nr:hypothetical protein [Alphaproteobacteria bacterium]